MTGVYSNASALAAIAMRSPREDDALPPPAVVTSLRDAAPKEMLKTKVFWLMFIMMTMMSTGDLMVIS
jgi:OFA family oxalate/formate antiporter-like MFS transporter